MFFFFTVISFSLIPRRSHIQKKDIEGFACTVCKGLAEGAKTFINEGYDLTEIQTKLLSQCMVVAQTDKAYYPMCQELSTKYVSILVQLVGSVGDSEKICVKLGYCSDLTGHLFQRSVLRNIHYLHNRRLARQKL